MGPLRFGAARAALALVALALASGLASAVPLPEINSQVRGGSSRERCCSVGIRFSSFSVAKEKRRDGPLPRFLSPLPDFFPRRSCKHAPSLKPASFRLWMERRVSLYRTRARVDLPRRRSVGERRLSDRDDWPRGAKLKPRSLSPLGSFLSLLSQPHDLFPPPFLRRKPHPPHTRTRKRKRAHHRSS